MLRHNRICNIPDSSELSLCELCCVEGSESSCSQLMMSLLCDSFEVITSPMDLHGDFCN